MTDGLSKIIPQIYQQHTEDMATYYNVVERKLFEGLKEVREKQATLLQNLKSEVLDNFICCTKNHDR